MRFEKHKAAFRNEGRFLFSMRLRKILLLLWEKAGKGDGWIVPSAESMAEMNFS